MSARALLASALVVSVIAGTGSLAFAEPMDPALERLVLNPGCHQSPGANGLGDFGSWNRNGGAGSYGRCLPDNAGFKRLVNQYGAALAPTAMHAARTTGYGGFELSLEGTFTSLDSDSDYMQNGTRGEIDASSNRASVRNDSPDPVAQVYYLKATKGFPFGFEMSGLVGTMANTSFIVIGTDMRFALLEGFRQGILGHVPDLSVGAGARTVTGSPQLQLTTVGLDGQLSKRIVIADASILTPYVGFQYLWIFGNSGLVDATPNTDSVGLCGYQGNNVPGTPGTPVGSRPYDGQPVCQGGTSLDFNNNYVFNEAYLARQRLIVGLQYQLEMLNVGVQYVTDVQDPAAANSNDKELSGVPRQFTISGSLGVKL